MNNEKCYIIWVKKIISNKDWNSWHSKINNVYCFLNKASDGVWIGFSAVNNCPSGCYQITDDSELQKIHKWRKFANIRPLPFDDDEEINDEGYVITEKRGGIKQINECLAAMRKNLETKGIIKKYENK